MMQFAANEFDPTPVTVGSARPAPCAMRRTDSRMEILQVLPRARGAQNLNRRKAEAVFIWFRSDETAFVGYICHNAAIPMVISLDSGEGLRCLAPVLPSYLPKKEQAGIRPCRTLKYQWIDPGPPVHRARGYCKKRRLGNVERQTTRKSLSRSTFMFSAGCREGSGVRRMPPRSPHPKGHHARPPPARTSRSRSGTATQEPTLPPSHQGSARLILIIFN
jgi:hypothetical protein